jgi:hypothetical protein
VVINVTHVIKTTREKHKEIIKYWCFRPAYYLMVKIFTTKVALGTPELMHKNHT